MKKTTAVGNGLCGFVVGVFIATLTAPIWLLAIGVFCDILGITTDDLGGVSDSALMLAVVLVAGIAGFIPRYRECKHLNSFSNQQGDTQ